jgi:hypothetical protein
VSATRSAELQARGVTGRADLMRLLAVAPRDTVVLDRDASGWVGYVRRHRPVSSRRHPQLTTIPWLTLRSGQRPRFGGRSNFPSSTRSSADSHAHRVTWTSPLKRVGKTRAC